MRTEMRGEKRARVGTRTEIGRAWLVVLDFIFMEDLDL